MKRLGLFLFAVLSIAVMFGGCAKETEKTVTSAEFNEKGTLTGFLRNAVTTEPISYTTEGENLVKIYLLQGSEIRTPNRLITDISDPLVGLYVYNDVPFTLYSNATYQLIVTVPGYQKFVTNVTPTALITTYGIGGTSEGLNVEFEGLASESTRVDAVYQGLGNIYLFPVGCTAGSVNITVRDALNRKVSGATVDLQPNLAGGGAAPTAETGNRLFPVAGHMPKMTATTDSAGVATFAESTLVLGGQYTPYVRPITFLGQQLAGTAGAAIVIGTTTLNQQITPGNLNPALYVVAASNSVAGSTDTSGVLTMTFDKAISLNTDVLALTAQFTAVVYDTTVPAVTATVAAALDATGKILTLTPIFTPAAGPTCAGATITYTHAAGGVVFLKDTQVPVGNLGGAGGAFAITDKLGNAIGSIVLIRVR